MNAKTMMAAILGHMDAKSERICMLDEKLRKAGDLSRFHSLAIEKAAAEIEQLGKRESELNALHDTIEALQGFSMQPEEKYAEYLQRLAADRAFHADESARRFTDLEHLKASTAQTLERLRAQLDQTNLQYTAEREKNRLLTEQLIEVLEELKGMCTSDDLDDARFERDNAREEAKTAIAEREHFRAKWDASLKARDSAQDEARRTRETNEALQGQLTLRSQIIARVMMDPATDKLFNERDWSDAARKVLIDARALVGENGTATA